MNYDGKNKKVRSSHVIEQILNNDYTLKEQDFYPPEDNRTLKSELVDIYNGERNAYYRYRKEYNRFIECEENDIDDENDIFSYFF